MNKHIIVIGGGIAGLSAAYSLSKDTSAASVRVTVLESAGYWGGKIRTDRVNGFVIEGGPDTFLASKPWGVALCRELGLEGRLHGTNPKQKNTYVLHRGRLAPLPEGLTMMIPTRFGPMARTGLLPLHAKARMGLDYFIPPRSPNGDESLGAFVSRRLGRAAYERLIEPLMSGIYAGDGDQLSLQATFPTLREMELKHGGLVRGALAARRQMMTKKTKEGMQSRVVTLSGSPVVKSSNDMTTRQRDYPTNGRSAFLTPTTGLAEIVESLVARLEAAGVELRLNAPAKRVARATEGYRVELASGENLIADAVILAAPAYASGDLLESLDAQLASELRLIPYTPTATISLAYRQVDIPRPLDGYGYVIPRREGRRALACTWTSTKFPHRSPDGFALLRVFAGRAGEEDGIPWDEAGLLDLAREELRMTLGLAAQPVLHRVYIWDRAMPQYNLGHPERLKRIEAALGRHPGLALAGNGYRGIGIPDCIHSGELAAENILHTIREILDTDIHG